MAHTCMFTSCYYDMENMSSRQPVGLKALRKLRKPRGHAPQDSNRLYKKEFARLLRFTPLRKRPLPASATPVFQTAQLMLQPTKVQPWNCCIEFCLLTPPLSTCSTILAVRHRRKAVQRSGRVLAYTLCWLFAALLFNLNNLRAQVACRRLLFSVMSRLLQRRTRESQDSSFFGVSVAAASGFACDNSLIRQGIDTPPSAEPAPPKKPKV